MPEEIFLPSFLLKYISHSFPRMEKRRMAMERGPIDKGVGSKMRLTLFISSSEPMTIMSNATISPDRYSYRPCP